MAALPPMAVAVLFGTAGLSAASFAVLAFMVLETAAVFGATPVMFEPLAVFTMTAVEYPAISESVVPVGIGVIVWIIVRIPVIRGRAIVTGVIGASSKEEDRQPRHKPTENFLFHDQAFTPV